MTGLTIPRRGATSAPPTLRERAGARLSSAVLDRELAAGTAPWTSPLHVARALQLTGRRQRRVLARELDRTLDEARRVSFRHRRASTAVPCRSSADGCAGLLEALAAELYGSAPLDAMWVARLRVIVHDTDSDLYVPGRSTQLHEQVDEIATHIVADS